MVEGNKTCRLEFGGLDPAAELAGLVQHSGGDGAVVSFVGLMRPTSAAGPTLTALHLDHHPTLTHASLVDIADSALKRFAISHAAVVHRCGDVRPREPIVFAAASAQHRRAAFEAVDYMMDRLKTDAIFWKREDGPDGSTWIGPRTDDLADRDRWER
ncbi:molybdenum cofactor biosynthesis protein MoaE [Sphingomonas piscis]|uniref:molybdenum cofactor biosynthesis protein MoaE n=1 Tax=Sphingomonas piscis TaxID=2714943 RepID=UPI0019D0565F|nr:molybdenum cofactor biosynthesis protein MoaE [Sphingomonas piscis]